MDIFAPQLQLSPHQVASDRCRAANDDAGAEVGNVDQSQEDGVTSTDDAEAEWTRRLVHESVRQLTEGRGDTPGWMRDLITSQTEISQPKVPWRTVLRRFLTKSIKSGQTYNRLNRRSAWRRDVILPAKYSKGVEHLTVVVDTSGSMSIAECNLVFAEINEIARLYPSLTVTLLQGDVRTCDRAEFTRQDLPIPQARLDSWSWGGRGGTDLRPIIADAPRETQAIIVLTDGWTPYPAREDIPTIWILSEDGQPSEYTPPYGEITYL